MLEVIHTDASGRESLRETYDLVIVEIALRQGLEYPVFCFDDEPDQWNDIGAGRTYEKYI